MDNEIKVICQYCNNPAELVTGDVMYPHRPDLKHLWFWRCQPCRAYVGAHSTSQRHVPKGSLANEKLRELRKSAHYAVDVYWQTGKRTRSAVYAHIAVLMGLTKDKAHIGKFDEQQCKRAIALANNHLNWS